MRQKEKKRKSKYPRLRPGEDQLSILPEEQASDRCPTLQVGGPATTAAPARDRTLSETPAISSQSTTRTPSKSTATQATSRTLLEGPATPARSSATSTQRPSTAAETGDGTPVESAATTAPSPHRAPSPSFYRAPSPSPDRAPAPSPDTTAASPERPAEGKKALRKGWRRKKKKPRTSKGVHFASLPDKYEPLEEGVGERESKQEKKYKRKQKAKKYAKNVGKALQTGCRYLWIGFQGLANAYATSWTVPAAVVAMAR